MFETSLGNRRIGDKIERPIGRYEEQIAPFDGDCRFVARRAFRECIVNEGLQRAERKFFSVISHLQKWTNEPHRCDLRHHASHKPGAWISEGYFDALGSEVRFIDRTGPDARGQPAPIKPRKLDLRVHTTDSQVMLYHKRCYTGAFDIKRGGCRKQGCGKANSEA